MESHVRLYSGGSSWHVTKAPARIRPVAKGPGNGSQLSPRCHRARLRSCNARELHETATTICAQPSGGANTGSHNRRIMCAPSLAITSINLQGLAAHPLVACCYWRCIRLLHPRRGGAPRDSSSERDSAGYPERWSFAGECITSPDPLPRWEWPWPRCNCYVALGSRATQAIACAVVAWGRN